MDAKNANLGWVELLFDTSQPYLYLVVLPALVLFALGYRNQALVFSCGSAAFLAFMGST